jgi:hypothetical protein
MDGTRTVRKLVEGKPGGRRKKGRSRSRWMDDVKLELKNMGVKDGGKELWIEENGLCLEGSQRQT